MKTSIDELLAQTGVPLKDTMYTLSENQINRFPITAGNFFCLESSEKWQRNYWIQDRFQERLWEKKQDLTYQGLLKMLREIKEDIAQIKAKDPKGYQHMPQLHNLRAVRHSLENALEELNQYYQSELTQEFASVYGIHDRKLLVYKNTVCLGSFADLERQIPVLQKTELEWLRKTPLLLHNTDALKKAVEDKVPIGLVGGPCLFGVYEMEIVVQHKDGQCFSFDFSSGRHYDQVKHNAYEFADHVEQWGGEIRSIHFRNWKKGVTAQEHESLEVLFVMGTVLHARVAIPIPDLSYLKYLSTMTAALEPSFRAAVLEEFRVEAYKIADMYLERIEQLKRKYPDVEVRVLHDRDREACKEFYTQREKFFQNSGVIHKLTARRKKTDAIFDYISMLALPYYFWKTPQVVQIDNLDETDSYRKCKKVHKGAFALTAVLYPEKISADGEQTIFNAPLEYKEYT